MISSRAWSADPIKIGVIGCADFARRRMMPAMAQAPEIELVAVASRDGGKAGEVAREFGCKAASSYTSLLELAEIEAVYVPLPLALHEEWVRSSLQAGKHVLAEKPLTISKDRTSSLIALAAQLDLVLMENLMFVHHSQHSAVRQVIADGSLGELRAFHAEFAIPRLPAGDIRYQPELGGGALWDVGVYPVRAALHFFGAGLEVAGAVLAATGGRHVDTCGSALLRTPTGLAAHLTFGLEHSYRSRYQLWGSAGCLTLDRAFTPPPGHRPVLRLEGAAGLTELSLEPDDQVRNALAAFARAVRARAAAPPVSLAQASLLEDIRSRAGWPLPV